jgi:heme/copper-type cytochrome/quinol oxidase subunit 2
MSYTYYDEQTKQNIEVPVEQWQWVVEYNDGSKLQQFDNDGRFHQFREINVLNVNVFKMVSVDQKNTFTLIPPDEAKLIHFYRNTVLNMGTTDEKHIKSYVFGYEIHTELGTTKKTLCLITPDNECIITDDIDKIEIR